MNINKQLLRLFEQKAGGFVSGEELSDTLQCSRTAIWKHVERLRKEGYVFEAVPRKGYRLLEAPDKLDIPGLLARLRTQVLGRQIRYYDQIDSTQIKAHELVDQGAEEGVLVVAEQQTAGRGRMGRKWHSPQGKGIWMSLVLKPRIPLHFAPQLTLLVAVALCRTIRRVTSLPVGIKWPNDLLVDGKKVSGILLESSAEEEKLQYVIVGVGISANLREQDYTDELKPIATSLSIASGRTIDRTELLSEFLYDLEKLYELYHEAGFGPIKTLWEQLSVSLDREVRTQTSQGPSEGTAIGLDDSGALIVRMKDNSVTKWYSGTVEFANPPHNQINRRSMPLSRE
ncbi:biotin--[acetyl-CoA-carboxylase] ligase [Paenibacillus xerothermodurans]|uniref:Bifunctional ligase/repressor BirA n=1 Tax=Paenibacillus xerothermodurans TaxID=1977292 RepID=A0A2W1NBU6_PAEXE|nr:biotin--[acetyl-CoA-carboxylase] ligase [Paenibacillus xerothermodurans]PZE21917.1 biotin--[acetyl-CoA-carboxylase] ligase [Paenibacillus xerothermodurans]